MTGTEVQQRPLPVAATLVRFSVAGAGVGAATALIVGLVTVGVMMAAPIGYGVAALGAVTGVPSGLVTGAVCILADRLSARRSPRTRMIAISLAGAAGAGASLAALALFGIPSSGPVPLIALAIGAVGGAVLSPLTVRWIDRRSAEPDAAASRYFAAAVPLATVAVLVTMAVFVYSSPWDTQDYCLRLTGDYSISFVSGWAPPQGTCISSDGSVEVVPRWIHAGIASTAITALVLIVLGARRSRVAASGTGPTIGSVAAGLVLLPLAVSMVVGVVQPIATAAPRAPVVHAPPAPPSVVDQEPEAVPDVGDELPAPEASTTFTIDELETVMQQLADESIAVLGPIDDPEIPEGIQSYPVTRQDCGAGTTRVIFEAWFGTADNAAGVARIDDYWLSLGYTVRGAGGSVQAAGRDPLPAEQLDVGTMSWREDALRLRLSSLCVVGGS